MTHKVQQGENLYRIGLKYGTTAEVIRILNKLPDYTIYVGQEIEIPGKIIIEDKLLISSFCITEAPIPQVVADGILKYHYIPINEVMKKTGLVIGVSLRSGYRPEGYEIETGRGGGSQHTYKEMNTHGIGATDWTSSNIELMIDGLIKYTNYRRIANYGTFVHCDYKDIDGTRRLYKGGEDWELIKVI